jgi:hypothetical protein
MRSRREAKRGPKHSGRSRWQQYWFPSAASASALMRSTAVIACAFILCAAISMVINPAAFSKFFFAPETLPELTGRSRSYYWDIALYGQLALQPACSAFYPLWADIIRWVFHPQTIVEAGRGFLVMATGLFGGALPLGLWLFQKTLGQRVGFGVALAYTLSPMAIFRVNGYSEGLFGVLSLLLLWVLLPLSRPTVDQRPGTERSRENLTAENFIEENLTAENLAAGNLVWPAMGWARWLALSGVTGLMALARPVMVQVVAAAIATLVTLLFFAWCKTRLNAPKAFVQHCQTVYRQPLHATGLLSLSAVVGYAVYGEFCLRTRGSFFAPFQDQALWKKAVGIHPELLLFPKSPLIDLLALYLPGLVLVVGFVWAYFAVTGRNLVGFVPRSPRWFLLCGYPPALILGYGIQSLRLKFLPQKPSLAPSPPSDAIPQTLPSEIRAPAATDLGTTGLETTGFRAINLETNYVFWFSVYFALSHSAIAFFTQDRLVSLGRYVFALPFIFLALGYLLRILPSKVAYAILSGLSGISAIWLIHQWVAYGSHKWLG